MAAASPLLGTVLAATAPLLAGPDFDPARYRADPVLYATERLAVDLMPHQEAVAYAVAGAWGRITDEMRELAGLQNEGQRKIAVRSGQKTGKSLLVIVLALWHFECFEASRTFMTAAKADQIKIVLWRELNEVLRRAPSRPAGVVARDPASGMISPDGSREIRGFTGRDVESVAGISGNLFFEVDEASHLEQSKAEAVEGNTAGEGDLGGCILYTSNPTRCEGPFFEAFHSRRDHWTRAHFDSETIARWQAKMGRRVRYTATLERVEQWAQEYGETSPFYLVRVKGDFLRNETGKIVSMHAIEAARARWDSGNDSVDAVLSIGFDPAGPGNAGDEHGFAAVRGHRCIKIDARRGLSEEAALTHLYALLDVLRRPGEIPRIMLDPEGNIGAAFYGRLRAESERRRMQDAPTSFDVYGVRTSSKHMRDTTKFERIRDEIWWCLAEWMAEGAIPPDHKLEAEVYAPNWVGMPDGRIRATPKVDLRDHLGRSPDRADALALAVWLPSSLRGGGGVGSAVDRGANNAYDAADKMMRSSGGGDAYDWERDFGRGGALSARDDD